MYPCIPHFRSVKLFFSLLLLHQPVKVILIIFKSMISIGMGQFPPYLEGFSCDLFKQVPKAFACTEVYLENHFYLKSRHVFKVI